MYLLRFPSTVEADRDTPTHNLSGRDPESERPPEYSPTDSDTLGIAGASQRATPNYSKRPSGNKFSPYISFMWILLVYYRIYAEDGAIPSNTAVAPADPFLGRIKVGSLPPPRTAKIVKRYIAKLENIKDHGSTSLFLTSYSKSPIDDTEKFTTILNGTVTGPGSNPQEPLALVAKMSDSERSALESDGRVGLASVAEHDITPPGIRYGAPIQQSSFLFVTLNCWEKCTINSTAKILKFHRK